MPENLRERIAHAIATSVYGCAWEYLTKDSQTSLLIGADAILALTPVEGVGEITDEQVRKHHRYRTLHEDFVTVETDLRNCAILIGHHYNSQRPVADKLKEVLSTPATAQGDVREALEKIVNWEMPETGQFWDNAEKEPMSYRACYGSHGERDHIISVARAALTTLGTPHEG